MEGDQQLADALRRVRAAIQWPGSEEEADGVYRRLAERLTSRGGPEPQALYLPRFGEGIREAEAEAQAGAGGQQLTTELLMELARLDTLSLAVRPSLSSSGVPVVGWLLDFVRAQFHSLVVYYVNLLAAQQAAHNLQVNRILHLLAEQVGRRNPQAPARPAGDDE